MAKPVATVIWVLCRPKEHEGGRCPAVEQCPRRVLKQETPGEPPMPPGMCQGCGTCVTACPRKAIRLQ